jgi:hypothetical protein
MRTAEKRKTPRIQPFVARCRVEDGTRWVSGYLTELSLKGARISCDDTPPAPGSAVALEVRLGRRLSSCRFPAEIKWVRTAARGPHTLGLTFRGISPEDQRILEAVVEEFRHRADQLV